MRKRLRFPKTPKTQNVPQMLRQRVLGRRGPSYRKRLTLNYKYISMATKKNSPSIDERLDRLSGIVETLAGAVTAHDSLIEAHDRQLGALITLAEKNQKAMTQMQREWQAYLSTLRRQ